jgi:hypothetical protein
LKPRTHSTSAKATPQVRRSLTPYQAIGERDATRIPPEPVAVDRGHIVGRRVRAFIARIAFKNRNDTGAGPIPALEGYVSDGVFDRDGGHLDAAISRKNLGTIPVSVVLAGRPGVEGFGGDRAALLCQPNAEACDRRDRMDLAGGRAVLG